MCLVLQKDGPVDSFGMTRPRLPLRAYYKRQDTLSLGICNGCQLMIELNLINPEHKRKTTMEHNVSHKFESQFLGLTIPKE